MSAVQLFLNAKRARHFDGRHPWVLQDSVIEPTVALEAGQTVELLNTNGSWIGRGVYNPNSRIRVRLYQWRPEQQLDESWLTEQLHQAHALRKQWMQQIGEQQAFRLINSEGDGLGGLIIDRFADYFIIQINSLAMFNWRETVLEWLQKEFEPRGIRIVVDRKIAKQEGLETVSDWVIGQPPESALQIEENGVALEMDLRDAQKTGYYLDQRSNRMRVAQWIPAGRMLDVCCYQGGFALAAFKTGKLTEAVAVDSSAKALEQAARNAERNGSSNIHFERGDCFKVLSDLEENGAAFESVVLDPPKMASNKHQLTSALRAYHRLNLSAVNLLKPGGILASCSCSGSVLRDDLVGVLSSVAKRTRRRIQVLEPRGADADHPYDVNCPETDYLKCLICRVE